MGLRVLIASVAAAVFAATAATAPLAAAAERQQDWTRTVVATPDGGFRMGNPHAPVQVVEYVSLTCPHCARFAADGAPRLIRDHVRGGRVSFEIRAYPLDPVAATAAQLTRCAAPSEAFALHDAILADQGSVFARLDQLSESEIGAIQSLPPPERRVRIAAATGIDAIAARHGLDAGETRACLADPAGAERIASIAAAAERIGIGSTPSFTVNGAVAVNVHDWAALEPLLAAAR